MNSLRTVICCLVVSACQSQSSDLNINWHVASRLDSDQVNQVHLGLAGPVTGIIDDVLLIAGGANFPAGMPWDGGKKAYQKEAFFYKISDNKELNFKKKVLFNDSIAYAANVSLEQSLYSIGGERNGRATADFFRYFIENDSLQRIQLPSLPIAFTNGNAVHINGYIYFVGGENEIFVSNKIYRYHLSGSQQWEEFHELPVSISNSVVTTDGNENIYILGGRKRNLNTKSTIYDQVYELNIASKRIHTVTNLPEPLAAGTGGYYNGNLIVIGGDNAATFHKVEELLGAINLESNENSIQELVAQKNDIQRNHPGFSRRVLMYHLESNTWKELNPLQGESPVTTTAIFKNNTIIIPSGEIKAGVRTDQILIGKIE